MLHDLESFFRENKEEVCAVIVRDARELLAKELGRIAENELIEIRKRKQKVEQSVICRPTRERALSK
ncbi:hypothetical protein AB3Y40_20155 [Yoonia sp. R2331]|uniref:hypothetical protein n=1 Tax=Yoonia sp. R2331 TaxID=3237238 RepID=UPI0034E575BB